MKNKMLALLCAFSFILNAFAMVNNDLLDLELAKQVVSIVILPVAQGLYETKKHVENACVPIVCLISLNNEIYSHYSISLKEETRREIQNFNSSLTEIFHNLTKSHYSLEIYKTLPKAFEKIKEHIYRIENLSKQEPCLQSYRNKYNSHRIDLACVNDQVSIRATFFPKETMED